MVYIKIRTIIDPIIWVFFMQSGQSSKVRSLSIKMVHIKISYITGSVIWIFLMCSGWRSKREALAFSFRKCSIRLSLTLYGPFLCSLHDG